MIVPSGKLIFPEMYNMKLTSRKKLLLLCLIQQIKQEIFVAAYNHLRAGWRYFVTEAIRTIILPWFTFFFYVCAGYYSSWFLGHPDRDTYIFVFLSATFINLEFHHPLWSTTAVGNLAFRAILSSNFWSIVRQFYRSVWKNLLHASLSVSLDPAKGGFCIMHCTFL